MRFINTHKLAPDENTVDIQVCDEPGPGGANHFYRILIPSHGNARYNDIRITFQNGPVAEVGHNGATQEALIAICIDRLRSFQAGPFSCRENALALTKLEEALHWLQSRTRDRQWRGVEGTNAK